MTPLGRPVSRNGNLIAPSPTSLPLPPPDLSSFLSKGFTVLKSGLTSPQCSSFYSSHVEPAIHLHSSYREESPSTYPPTVPGDMVRDTLSSPGKQIDPIPPPSGRWPSLFNSPPLLSFLDALHGSAQHWEWLHDDNVGWIHLRFPNYTPSSTKPNKRNKPNKPNKPIKTAPESPYDGNWHVDGSHFNPHLLTSPEQSAILLPMLRDVSPGGGNTLVLRNSHFLIASFLHNNGSRGVSQRRLIEYASFLVQTAQFSDFVEVAPAEAGDLLIMHPFVVHTSSRSEVGKPWRVSFNMGTKWANGALPKDNYIQDALQLQLAVEIDSNVLYYDQAVFIKGLDRNNYFESYHEETKGLFCGSPNIEKENSAREFRFEDAGGEQDLYKGKRKYLRVGEDLFIRCRGSGEGGVYDGGGFICATSEGGVTIVERIIEGCLWTVQSFFQGKEGEERKVRVGEELFLFNVERGRHLHVEYESGVLGCKWNDRGNWQRFSFEH